MLKRPANIVLTVVIVTAIILLIVFGVTREAVAPTVEEDNGKRIEENAEVDSGKRKVDNGPVQQVVEEKALECGQKNSECSTSDDCCGNLGLTCQDVRTTSGGFGKRCLPVEVQICRSDCTNGTWNTPRSCRSGVAPSAMQKCETFVGDECKESVHADRNTRECWNT